MTIAFAGLISSQLVDRVGVRAGLVSLPLLIVAGAAAVIYWRATERAGAGNVMPYAVLQGYAVVVLLLLDDPRYRRATPAATTSTGSSPGTC